MSRPACPGDTTPAGGVPRRWAACGFVGNPVARTAHLNQPVEVAALRPQFARLLGITSERPDLVIRFGRGPELPRSLRRPVETVLLQAAQ